MTDRGAVDRDAAFAIMPAAYTTALRLVAEGQAEGEIATVLNIPEEAVRPLLHLAEAKLARLVNEGPDSAP